MLFCIWSAVAVVVTLLLLLGVTSWSLGVDKLNQVGAIQEVAEASSCVQCRSDIPVYGFQVITSPGLCVVLVLCVRVGTLRRSTRRAVCLY